MSIIKITSIYTIYALYTEIVLDSNSSTIAIQPHVTVYPPLYDGVYMCIVLNDAGIGVSTSVLHVSPVGSVAVMPSFFNATIGEDYTSICSGQGSAVIQFKWTNARTRNFISKSSSLFLKNVALLDGGIYECTVSNLAGEESRCFTLYCKFSNIIL